MPVTVGLSAAVGAYLGHISALGALTAIQGALLYGGLAGAQYLLRQQPRVPRLQGSRTSKTIQLPQEPERYVFGRRRVSGVMLAYEENKAKVEGVMRPDGQNNATEIGESRYWSFPLYFASHPCDGIESVWIEGIEQLLQPEGKLNRAIHRSGPDTFLVPLAAPDHSLDDADERSPIIPPRDGLWGIGHGQGAQDYYRNDGTVPGRPDLTNERLSGTTRNLEWQRWPWILWPRMNGFGKPPWAGPRSGNGWWDYRKQGIREGDGQRNGPDEWAYVVADFYQNARADEDVERTGYSWNKTVPEVELLVRGMRIALPDENGVEQEPVWTENAAAVCWWYVRTQLDLPIQALDIPMWRDALAVCDEIIQDQGVEGDDPREISATRTTTRYTAGGVVVSGDPADSVLRELAFCMDGAITTSGGRIAVQPGRMRTADHDIPAEHVLPGVQVQVQPALKDRANRANMGLQQSALHGWGPHPMTEVWNEAGERNDGRRYETDMGERAYMTSPVRAHALMEAELLRIRVEGGLRMAPVYTFRCISGPNDEHLALRELQRITFSYEPLGLDKVEVEILTVSLSPKWILTIVGRGNASVAPAMAPVYCPGFGDAPPSYPSAASGHIGTLYLAPSTIIPTIRAGRA